MIAAVFTILFLTQNSNMGSNALPVIQKFGYAQAIDDKVLFSYFKGSKGHATLMNLTSSKVSDIDSNKANFFFPIPLLHQNKFVLLDPLLKKVFFIDNQGDLLDSVFLKDRSPALANFKIAAASVYDSTNWLLTLQEQQRKVYVVGIFSLDTGKLAILFEDKIAGHHRTWTWLNGSLYRAEAETGELAKVDMKTGKRLKILQSARDPLMPRSKREWMPKLEPLSRMGHLVFGAHPSIVAYLYKDDDPDRLALSALTFVKDGVVETPISVLGEYGGKRLLYDWDGAELILEGTK